MHFMREVEGIRVDAQAKREQDTSKRHYWLKQVIDDTIPKIENAK